MNYRFRIVRYYAKPLYMVAYTLVWGATKIFGFDFLDFLEFLDSFEFLGGYVGTPSPSKVVREFKVANIKRKKDMATRNYRNEIRRIN